MQPQNTKPRWLVTVRNNSRVAEAWFVSRLDADYFYGGMKYSTKVARTTLHEFCDGTFSIRADFQNRNHRHIPVPELSDALLPCFREKILV